MRHHFPREGGRFFNGRDEAEKRRVVFFGDELAHDVFGELDPVGQVVDLAGSPFLVIGVLQKKLQMGNYGGPDAQQRGHPDHHLRGGRSAARSSTTW